MHHLVAYKLTPSGVSQVSKADGSLISDFQKDSYAPYNIFINYSELKHKIAFTNNMPKSLRALIINVEIRVYEPNASKPKADVFFHVF